MCFNLKTFLAFSMCVMQMSTLAFAIHEQDSDNASRSVLSVSLSQESEKNTVEAAAESKDSVSSFVDYMKARKFDLERKNPVDISMLEVIKNNLKAFAAKEAPIDIFDVTKAKDAMMEVALERGKEVSSRSVLSASHSQKREENTVEAAAESKERVNSFLDFVDDVKEGLQNRESDATSKERVNSFVECVVKADYGTTKGVMEELLKVRKEWDSMPRRVPTLEEIGDLFLKKNKKSSDSHIQKSKPNTREFVRVKKLSDFPHQDEVLRSKWDDMPVETRIPVLINTLRDLNKPLESIKLTRKEYKNLSKKQRRKYRSFEQKNR